MFYSFPCDSSGLENGAVIVLSSLDVATEGMQVRTEIAEPQVSDNLISDKEPY